MKPTVSTRSFIVVLAVLNLVLAFYATPVTDLGDASSYIGFSKTLLGEASYENYAHRSPLYSLILAFFMLFFSGPVLFKVTIVFQYLLVAVTAWLAYWIFCRVLRRKEQAMAAVLLFNLSFSTVYYANIILTEILTAFLLILSVALLLRISDRDGLVRIVTLATAVGLLSLARFNTIPMIVTIFVLLGYILLRRKVAVIKWIYSMMLFIITYLFIMNIWCIYNYQHNGFYGLFPGGNIGVPRSPRNITIASIRPGNIVSEKNKPVLEIFLKARKEYLELVNASMKGSLAQLDKWDFLSGLYSGYRIYGLAYPGLKAHYNLSAIPNEVEITDKLISFLNEIAAQNRSFIWKYRFYSFFSGFRAASGGVLPIEYGKINLNILPAITFKIYKLAFFSMSVFVFFAFFFFLISIIKTRFNPDITLMTMFFIVFSFWGINFVFFTVGDANRFKFPAEPLIIGLFVHYVCEITSKFKAKKPLTHNER